MTNSNIYDFIMKYARGPHFHQEFPIILFWSQKADVHHLLIGFYQINLFKEAIKYNPFIHNYEFDIYKNSVYYFTGLANALSTNEKPAYKLVRTPIKEQ